MKLFNFNKDTASDVERYQSVVHVLVIFSVLLALMVIFQLFEVKIVKANLTYENLVSIMLTALGLMLAFGSILLGVMAFVGWSTFQDTVRNRVTDEVTKRFGKDGDLRPFLSEELTKMSVEQEKTSKDPSSYLNEADATKDVDG